MTIPFIGEIRMFAGNFAPQGWMFCDGSTLPIAEYDVLFNLIATTYGGDGEVTFKLPDLRGRVPIGSGSGPGLSTRYIGQSGGVENVVLTANQLAAHSHPVLGTAAPGVTISPAGLTWASYPNAPYRAAAATAAPMSATAVGLTGSGQAHENRAPYLSLNFIIAMQGIFPSEN